MKVDFINHKECGSNINVSTVRKIKTSLSFYLSGTETRFYAHFFSILASSSLLEKEKGVAGQKLFENLKPLDFSKNGTLL